MFMPFLGPPSLRFCIRYYCTRTGRKSQAPASWFPPKVQLVTFIQNKRWVHSLFARKIDPASFCRFGCCLIAFSHLVYGCLYSAQKIWKGNSMRKAVESSRKVISELENGNSVAKSSHETKDYVEALIQQLRTARGPRLDPKYVEINILRILTGRWKGEAC